MSTEKTTKEPKKTRNWACVVYPESAPESWREILSEAHIPAFISPLHDKDINPGGEVKKPHYHVLVMFDGPRERSLAEKFFQSFGGVGCEYVNSLRGYARYLTHLDNPEKHQYSQDDVICICGANYNSVIGLPTDKYKLIKEMIAFCKAQGILAYSDLLDYAMIERDDWFQVLCDSGTYVVKEYLKSAAWIWEKRKTWEGAEPSGGGGAPSSEAGGAPLPPDPDQEGKEV